MLVSPAAHESCHLRKEDCMAKKIVAFSCGVLLGVVIAFARAEAFPFWNSSSEQTSKSQSRPPEKSAQTASNPQPAPANQPEPSEVTVPIHSFAPLVKRVID